MTETITPEQTAQALTFSDTFNAAIRAGGHGLAEAMEAIGVTDEDEARKIGRLGMRLQVARDDALDELAQLVLGVSLAEVQADRATAYRRTAAADEAALAEWLPEVCAGGETTPDAVRAVLAHVTRDS